MSQRDDDAKRLLYAMTDVDDRFVQEALHSGRIRKHSEKAKVLKFQRAAAVIIAAAACGGIAVAAGRFGLLRRSWSSSLPQESPVSQQESPVSAPAPLGSDAESIAEDSGEAGTESGSEVSVASADRDDGADVPGDDSERLQSPETADALQKQASSDSMQAAANPYQEVSSLSEAAAIAGFSFSVPEADSSYPKQVVNVVNQSMIQVDYTASDGSDTEYSVRKAEGSDDISGNYNSYENSEQQTVNGAEVTLKGNGDTWSVAIWTADGYTYAVDAEDHPMSEERILEIISDVK